MFSIRVTVTLELLLRIYVSLCTKCKPVLLIIVFSHTQDVCFVAEILVFDSVPSMRSLAGSRLSEFVQRLSKWKLQYRRCLGLVCFSLRNWGIDIVMTEEETALGKRELSLFRLGCRFLWNYRAYAKPQNSNDAWVILGNSFIWAFWVGRATLFYSERHLTNL